jgi:hypothetical protein
LSDLAINLRFDQGILLLPGPSAIAASHEGFTSLSLASVHAFGLPSKSRQKNSGVNTSAGDVSSLSSTMNSGQSIKQKSASGLAYPSTALAVRHSTKPIVVQPKPPSTSAMSVNPSKMIGAPPSSAFRPPSFIVSGATPNAASAATGAKRRLGMGHLVGSSLSAQKVRKVEKEVKSGGGGGGAT